MSTIKLSDCEHILEVADANFANSSFSDVRLAESIFREVTFEGSRFEQTHMDGSVFDTVSLAGVSIRNGHYEGMTIDGIAVTELLDAYRRAQAPVAQ